MLWLGWIQAGCMEEVAFEVGPKGQIGLKHRKKGRVVSQAGECPRLGAHGKEQNMPDDVELSPWGLGAYLGRNGK